MLMLVVYDICTDTPGGPARLRKAAKLCLAWGRRVQNSVYECEIDAEQYRNLKESLSNLIHEQSDSIRFYRLGNHSESRIECIGRTAPQLSFVI